MPTPTRDRSGNAVDFGSFVATRVMIKIRIVAVRMNSGRKYFTLARLPRNI